MDLKPNEVLALTQREFHIIAEENVDKMHDRNEQEAMYAIFYAAASRGKGKQGKLPSVKDLYDRNKFREVEDGKDSIEAAIKNQKQAEEWLKRFNLNELT